MTNVTVSTITSLGDASAITQINNNFALLASALNNDVIYKTGTTALTADLDLNGHKLLNLAAPSATTDVVRKGDISSLSGSDTAAAAASAAAAAASASSASASASSASTSASNASGSASSTSSLYTSFQTLYLGAKASDPSVDNQGNTLQTGALVLNTTAGTMKYWSGSSWVAAYVSAGSFLPLAGGTMTGKLNTVASGTANAGVNIPHGSAPTTPTNGDIWSTTAGLFFRANGTTQGPLTGGTFTGGTLSSALITTASVAGAAGFNVPHGTAPTTPNNGDFWSTTGGFFGRLNGTTVTFSYASATETLTNKTVNLTSNTLSGTTAQFNAALSDNDFATLAGSETLTNKTLGSGTTFSSGSIQAGVAISDSGGIGPGSPGFRGLPFLSSGSTNYTFVSGDESKCKPMTTGGWTIPANSSVAYQVGTILSGYNNSASSQTVAITTDTLRLEGTATTGTRTVGQYSRWFATKVASTEWVISGVSVT